LEVWPWVRRWLFTTYHRDVGLLYIFTSFYFGIIGGLLAVLMRVQLSVPNNNFLTAVYYNQAVTMHGLIMIFWFLSPLAIGFANYIVPLQIGAKDLAFPRLNALSYWLFLTGGLLAVVSFFVPGGATAAGWTNYQPLATLQLGSGPTLDYLGLVLMAASVTLGSVNILTTIFWMRGPGVTISKIPMFTWFMFFTVLAMLFAFPTLVASFSLAASDRILGTVFFSNPSVQPSILWDNLFWFFGHPEVYIVLLPAFGVIANVIPVFTGRPLAGKNTILIATAAVVLPLSFGVWLHHMFVTGLPATLDAVFSISTEVISIPFVVVIVVFVASIFRGSIRFKAPFLFSLGAIVLFIIGGVMGVFLSSPVLDRVLHGSYFVVSHFHYVMVGAGIFGLFAGVYYWFPKISGRMYNESLARVHFVVSFIGFNVLYFPMSFLMDMPRRIFTYQNVSGWPQLNSLASLGAVIFAGAQILLAYNVLNNWFRGPAAAMNPWGSEDLEWSVDGPSIPTTLDSGDFSVKGGWIEHMAIAPGSSQVGQMLALPRAESTIPPAWASQEEEAHGSSLSSRPITLSVGAMIFLLAAAFFPSVPAIAGMVLGSLIFLYSVAGWALDDMRGRFSVALEKLGDRYPFSSVPKMKLGMWVFLSSEMVLFGSFIGAYVFLRASASGWPIAGSVHDIPLGTANTLILLSSGFTMALAVQAIRNGDQRRLLMWLGATFLLGSSFMGIKISEWINLASSGFVVGAANPVTSLAASSYYFLVGLHGAHVVAGLIVMIYLMKKTASGMYTKDEHGTIENFGLYWAFVDIVWCFLFPLFYLL